jgi:hypothetical protein
LEELTHYDVNARIEARGRNLVRLNEAKQRKDVAHLEAHYTCCVDKIQLDALEELLTCDERQWLSFTLQGINGLSDFYARPASLESLTSLFMALRTVEVLNLHSCTLSRGHGLEVILKTIPFLSQLRELRLHGWQMDRISISNLILSLKEQDSKAVTLLSLRSCYFLGEDTFTALVSGLSSIEQLRTLNLSYCNLGDNEIIPLVHSLKSHPSIKCLHIGGNSCVTTDSVNAIADWVKEDSCQLQDLNLRALWIGFSEEGLVQRLVGLANLYHSLSVNKSLQNLTLSENYLENDDIDELTTALSSSPVLSFLDVADNPFEEKGAETLLRLVYGCRALESVRFENYFMTYRCADAIKTYARFNYADRRLVDRPVNLPLSLWPNALSRVQNGCGDRIYSYNGAPDVIFHLLQSSTGDFGLPLSLRIATQH